MHIDVRSHKQTLPGNITPAHAHICTCTVHAYIHTPLRHSLPNQLYFPIFRKLGSWTKERISTWLLKNVDIETNGAKDWNFPSISATILIENLSRQSVENVSNTVDSFHFDWHSIHELMPRHCLHLLFKATLWIHFMLIGIPFSSWFQDIVHISYSDTSLNTYFFLSNL